MNELHGKDNLVGALDESVESVLSMTVPKTWSGQDATTSQPELLDAVTKAIFDAASLAGHLGVVLLPPQVAPTDSRCEARRLLATERDHLRAGVANLAAPAGIALSVLGDRLDAVVSAALAVADQHGVTARIRLVLNAAAPVQPDPAATHATGWSIACGGTS
jgi:hypothetical protein